MARPHNLACTRLRYLARFQRFHAHCSYLCSEGSHAATAQRVKPTVRLMDETVCGGGAHFIRFDIKAPSLGGQRNSMLDSIKMLAHGPAEMVCHKVCLT